jgi:hypothetical protein
LPTRPGSPFASTDRPVCRVVDGVIVTGGDALEAEVARGVVALENCVIACGGRAIILHPQAVRRDRFEADLWLDRCTIAAARAFVQLGPWLGWGGGPDRPWLVSTRACAFVDAFSRSLQQSPVLLADAAAMARGVLFWQAERDAYEVARFAATAEAFVPKGRGADVGREWVDFWGGSHIVNVTGPVPTSREPVLRLLADRLKTASMLPKDLELNPDIHPGRRTLDVGADLSRLKIKPANGPGLPPGRSGIGRP